MNCFEVPEYNLIVTPQSQSTKSDNQAQSKLVYSWQYRNWPYHLRHSSYGRSMQVGLSVLFQRPTRSVFDRYNIVNDADLIEAMERVEKFRNSLAEGK